MDLDRITKRTQWQAAFLCFIVAMLAGALYRLGMIYPLPGELSLQNIRHAHSHLMFFGWATPLPLYIFWTLIRNRKPGKRIPGTSGMAGSVWAILLFGLISFPFFLLYGYHPVPVAGGEWPLSVISSGLVMLGWYGFMAGYLQTRDYIKPSPAMKWFEAALVLLCISSLGAWGVAAIQALGPANPLYGKALTHFFLAAFTEGWVVLVTIAILLAALKIDEAKLPVRSSILIGMIMIGAPLTFPYGISESLMTPAMYYTARAGGLLAAVSLLIIVYSMYKAADVRGTIWIWPLALLGVKALMQLLASLAPAEFWLSDHALRILYLHVLLLGAMTLAGVGYLHHAVNVALKYYYGLLISILAVLASLVLLTRFWPVAWGGNWVYYAVAGSALLPLPAIAGEWIRIRNLQAGAIAGENTER